MSSSSLRMIVYKTSMEALQMSSVPNTISMHGNVRRRYTCEADHRCAVKWVTDVTVAVGAILPVSTKGQQAGREGIFKQLGAAL